MIKAVFFDFYNTLVRFWPPVEEIQVGVCRGFGITVTKDGIQKGYGFADEYFNKENARLPLAQRSENSRSTFFALYEQMILDGSGLSVTLDLAKNIWSMTTLVPKSFVTFSDVLPTFKRLKEKGLIIGVLSNLHQDMESVVRDLGLDGYLDFSITSRQAGAEKPKPPIFLSALNRAGIDPDEAAHVGDQYYADVEGARSAGIIPLLLDRSGWHTGVTDCKKIESLREVIPWLTQR